MCTLFAIILLGACAHQYKRIPSQNYDTRVKSLVMHFTAGDYVESLSALVDAGGLSSHFLLPAPNDASYPYADLRILQLVPEHARAWHAGVSSWQNRFGLNDTSIGIEIVYEPQCNSNIPYRDAGWQGANRPCTFPEYPQDQIALLIELSQALLARYPDIHPTAIIGHSDIAPQRKNDPGPNFPWRTLAEAGIGAWYDELVFTQAKALFKERLPSLLWLQLALAEYGYATPITGCFDEATSNVISAFQMHFTPTEYQPVHTLIQPEEQLREPAIYAAILALHRRYFPDFAERLEAAYHNSTAEHLLQSTLQQKPVIAYAKTALTKPNELSCQVLEP